MDCLVMNLPAEVTDTSLRKLGEMRLTLLDDSVHGELDMAFDAGANRGTARLVTGTGYFSNSSYTEDKGTEVQEGHLYTVNGDGGFLYLGNKQHLTSIVLYSGVLLNLEEVKYCSALTSLATRSGTLEGDISNLSELLQTLTRLDFRSVNNVYGDLSVFSEAAGFTSITLERTKCTGSILNFSKCHSLSTLYAYASTTIEGDPDYLADAMYNEGNGRTEGTLTYTSPANTQTIYTFTNAGWTKS